MRVKVTSCILIACSASMTFAFDGMEDSRVSELGMLEEVIVTAQKRSESLQDVPVSVSAFSGDELNSRQIRTMEDLAISVPNLQVTSPLGQSLPVFSLRGISMSDYSLNQNSPIAVYYDEVYKGAWAILGLNMYDLERVEVLKGPQGTLYGKNTTGGAVNMVAQKPSFEQGGYLSLGYGNYNHYLADGAYEAVLNENAALRVAFAAERADGYMESKYPGKPDLNDTNQYGGRGTLRYQPGEALNIVVGASFSVQNTDGQAISPLPGESGIGGGIYNLFGRPGDFRQNLGEREINSSLETYRDFKTYALFTSLDFQLADELQLKSITSWDRGDMDFNEDSDGSVLPIGEATYRAEVDQITQDIRLTSDYSSDFNFIVGAYYSKEDIENSTDLLFLTDIDLTGDGSVDSQDCLANFFIACGFGNIFDQEKTSYALYSDITYALTDTLKLRGGLRYTHDKGKLTDFSAQLKSVEGDALLNIIPGNYTLPLHSTTSREFRDDNVSGKLGLDYELAEDVLIFGSYSKGYRSAAFNAQAFFLPEELSVASPEEVDAFEIGFKSEFLKSRLRLNGSGFLYRYENQQVLDVNPQNAAQVLVNLPESEILGAELDIKYQASSSIVLSTGIGYLDSEIKESVSGGSDISGNKLQAAPTWSFSGSIEWSVDLGQWTADARLDGSYRSDYHYDLVNSHAALEDGYGILNSQVRFYPPDESFGLTLWVKNLTDEFYSPAKYDVLSGFGYVYRQINAPRTYGVSFDIRF